MRLRPPSDVRRPSLAWLQARILQHANLDLAAEAVREAEARGRVRQAALSPNPFLLVRKRRIRDFELFTTGWVEVEVGQPIELGHKRAMRIRQAQAEAATVSEEIRALTLSTLRDAELHFYRVLRLQSDREQAREELGATTELKQLADSRFEQGKDSRVAVLRLDAQAEDARITVEDFERKHAQACRLLDMFLGVESGTVQGVTGRFEEATLSSFDREDSLKQLARHPRRLARVKAADAACRAVDRADADAWPDLTVGLGGQYDHDTGNSYFGFMFLVPLPLWNRNQGTRAETRAAAIRARRALDAEELRMRVELDDALIAYERSGRNARGYAEKILPALQESLDLTRQAYEAGRTSYLNVLDALIALIRARRSHFGHLEMQAQASVVIRYLTSAG